VRISINPIIEFVADKDNKVVAVNPDNTDAENLIAEIDFIGMELEDAVEKFIELATEAGYIDVDSRENQVTITVLGDADEEKTEKSLEERIYKYFENNGIFGKVRRETLEAYAEQAAQLDISTGKMKMVMRALDMGADYTIEQLAKMPMNELVHLFKDKAQNENPGATLRDAFKAERDALKAEYPDMFELGEEIEALEAEIAAFTGSAEEKAALESELAQKKDAYDTLRAAYNAEKKAIIDRYKEMRNEQKEARKAAIKSRIEAHKEKIKAHREKVKNNKGKLKREIRKWQKENAA